MAISEVVDVLAAALWPQGDIRDPLGTWGFRIGITGDASGGSLKVTARAPAGLSAAYIYTCYSLLIAQLTGTFTNATIKSRLLTNWPNVDVVAGVQGYSTAFASTLAGTGVFTAPGAMPFDHQLVQPLERFLLLFDPRPSPAPLNLIELELGLNINLATYSFEGYGYFWDRGVLQAPGGPRHPGAS